MACYCRTCTETKEIACVNCNRKFLATLKKIKYRGAKFCSRKCANLYNGVVKHKIAEAKKVYPLCACGCGLKCRYTYRTYRAGHNKPRLGQPGLRGAANPRWTGGKPKRIHSSPEHRVFRKAVFERDNYTCQHCFKRGIRLNAHHIKSVSSHPELISDTNNGITLCHDCHWDEHRRLGIRVKVSLA